MTTAEPGRGRDDATDGTTFTVLLATDGQPAAEAAEQLVRRLADPQRVAVTVLGVSSFELALREGKRAEGRYSPDAARRSTQDAVTAAAERLTAAGFETDTHVEHDDPALRILDTAERRGSDLIVLGGRPWGLPGPAAVLDRFRDDPADAPPSESDADDTATAFDSVSTSVLHRADTPVMVVHGEPMDGPDSARIRVVVGADGSPASMAAIRALGGFADPTGVEVRVDVVDCGAAADTLLDRVRAVSAALAVVGSPARRVPRARPARRPRTRCADDRACATIVVTVVPMRLQQSDHARPIDAARCEG